MTPTNLDPPVPVLLIKRAYKLIEYAQGENNNMIKTTGRLAFMAFILFSGTAQAAPESAVTASTAAAGAPTLAVQDLVSSARAAANDRVSAVLDLHEMARLILAKNWDKLKPADRERYASLLSGLVEKIGYPQIQKFFNGRIEITYTGERTLDGGASAVFTSIFYKDEDLTLTTEFRLHPTEKGWRIYDVITDGESLLLIYRNQHSGIIRDKGFPQLIKLMEKKFNEAK